MGQTNDLSPKSIKIGDKLEANPAKMAEAFSLHHKEKIQDLRKKVAINPTIKPAKRVRKWLRKCQNEPPVFTLKPITSNKLHQLLRRLKPGKALPQDDIDAKTIKDAAPVLEPAIKHIVNLSLCRGHFADKWKPQVIAPHHKKDDKTDVSNYT